jgi:hypothetical protein
VKSVYLPNTIKHINDEAFKDASKLENINLSNTIETLGNNAFYSSSSKRNLNIAKLPESLISIGDQCFYNGGPGITVSDLPLGVKTIGSYAFQDCANLTIHEFPAHPDGTICSIGQGAFVNSCKVDSVTEITINSPWSLPKEKTYYGVFGRAESNGADGYSNVTVINVHTNLYNALGGTELDVIEACFGDVSDPNKVDIYEEKFTVTNISETLEEV